MKSSVGSHEARTHFSQLLRRAANGEHITITRRGVPVAILAPVPPPAPARDPKVIRESVEEMRRFREGQSLGRGAIREVGE